MRPRSHCTSCGRTLKVLDLIPIVSYLAVHGRCRYCKAPISPRYLLVELFSGLTFVLIFYRYYISFTSFALAIIFSIGLIGGIIVFDKWASIRGE